MKFILGAVVGGVVVLFAMYIVNVSKYDDAFRENDADNKGDKDGF